MPRRSCHDVCEQLFEKLAPARIPGPGCPFRACHWLATSSISAARSGHSETTSATRVRNGVQLIADSDTRAHT
eukprot:4650566-Alexandrium_andersonii.AAC.1